jgi:antitoxin (DNA-binding transcriptional repressor) of toxin-antitoxin stability system
MRVVTLEEAREQLNDLLASVLQGENVVIRTKQGMVQLTAMLAARPRQFGSARGMVTLGEDFDAPLEDFPPYMS